MSENLVKSEAIKYERKGKTEFYINHPFLPDGNPDQKVIKETFKWLQNIINSLGKPKQENTGRPTILRAGFFPAHSRFGGVGGVSVKSSGETVEVTDVLGAVHVFYPASDKWEAYWERVKIIGDWNEKLKSQLNIMDGTNYYFDLKHKEIEISMKRRTAEAPYPGWFPYYEHINAIENLVGENFHNIHFGKPSSEPISSEDQGADRASKNTSIIFDHFTKAFQYQVIDGKIINKIILNDDIWEADKVVYARTSKREIVYIGKTDGKLKSRMNGHIRLFDNYTKQRDLDYKSWSEGKTITIYAYKPECADCLDGSDRQLRAGGARADRHRRPPVLARRRRR